MQNPPLLPQKEVPRNPKKTSIKPILILHSFIMLIVFFNRIHYIHIPTIINPTYTNSAQFRPQIGVNKGIKLAVHDRVHIARLGASAMILNH